MIPIIYGVQYQTFNYLIYVHLYLATYIAKILSLSTIVLNSRDWYEIIWLPKILRFKNQPCNRFYPAEMHW